MDGEAWKQPVTQEIQLSLQAHENLVQNCLLRCMVLNNKIYTVQFKCFQLDLMLVDNIFSQHGKLHVHARDCTYAIGKKAMKLSVVCLLHLQGFKYN